MQKHDSFPQDLTLVLIPFLLVGTLLGIFLYGHFHQWSDLRGYLTTLPFGVLAIVLVWFVVTRHRQVPPDVAYVIGDTYYEPNSTYYSSAKPREIPLKPQLKLVNSGNRSMIVKWSPDITLLGRYLSYTEAKRDGSDDLAADLKRILSVNPRPDIEYLNRHHADHFGVVFLSVEFPPQPAKVPVVPQPSFYEQQVLESVNQIHTLAQLEEFERDVKTKYAPLIAANPAFGETITEILKTTRRNIFGS